MVDETSQRNPAAPPYTIIVNGRTTSVESDHQSFNAVVDIAFPDGGRGENIAYAVTYYNGNDPVEGGLTEDSPPVKIRFTPPYTVFNVTRTDRS